MGGGILFRSYFQAVSPSMTKNSVSPTKLLRFTGKERSFWRPPSAFATSFAMQICSISDRRKRSASHVLEEQTNEAGASPSAMPDLQQVYLNDCVSFRQKRIKLLRGQAFRKQVGAPPGRP